jgi:nucleoside phosphorylase
MGMQAAASVGAKLIAKFSPQHVFINGICAGLGSASLNLGDIVVATQSWDYESGKVNENSNGELVFTPEMKVIPTDQGMISHLTSFSNDRKKLFELHDQFKGSRPEQQPAVRFGPVGSGPYVLSSSQYLNKLTQTERKLIAIDMEGYGIYKAAQYFKSVIPIFIKGVSDLGDKNKSDDYHKYAAYASSKFTVDFIHSYF